MVRELTLKHPGANVDFMRCDLASFESVRSLASAFLERQLPLHCLINNAGIMLPQHAKSPEVTCTPPDRHNHYSGSGLQQLSMSC